MLCMKSQPALTNSALASRTDHWRVIDPLNGCAKIWSDSKGAGRDIQGSKHREISVFRFISFFRVSTELDSNYTNDFLQTPCCPLSAVLCPDMPLAVPLVSDNQQAQHALC